MLGDALFQGLLVMFLIAANAFFVAAEFALVSLRDTRLLQLIEAGKAAARTVQRLHANMDEVLSSVQLGVTLTSLALGWVGEPAFAHIFEHWIGPHESTQAYIHIGALSLAFILITFMHIVLGEIVPKTLSLQRAERIALTVATPMELYINISRPLLRVISGTANAVTRLFGATPRREGGVHSAEELKLLVTASRRTGLLPKAQEDMVLRALELELITVREIMVPRTAIFSLPSDMPLAEAAGKIVEMQHSRVPIYDSQRGPEHIIGAIYSKDISRYMHHRLRSLGSVPMAQPLTARSIMRDVLVVPETQPVSDLLVQLQARRRHLAVVVDEFGSTVGLVTVEDALEQIVGEIEDEFDVAQPVITARLGDAVVLDGSEKLLDLEAHHSLSLPRDQGFETLAGFLLAKLGHIPQGGESIEHSGKRFTVLTMQGLRIEKVKVEPKNS